MASDRTIITCALTGAQQGKAANPALPEQPDEIAQAVKECHDAGAGVVHIHARGKDGIPTNDPVVFSEINAQVRDKCDIIIQNSIAPANKPGGGSTAEDGWQTLDAKPEMASLDMGICCITHSYGEQIIEWTRSFLKKTAKMMLDAGIKPELEIYNNSNMEDVYLLIQEGLLTKPYYHTFVMGMNKINQAGTRYTPQHLQHYIDLLPEDSRFNAMGIGPSQLPATTHALIAGGGARVGFEDNIYFRKGELAKNNAQLVERTANFVHDLGLEVASPAEARDILGIPQLS